MVIVKHKKSSDILNNKPKLPSSNQLVYGEIAINYADGQETIAIKNSKDEIVEFRPKEYIDSVVQKLIKNTELKFYCIEPVSIFINGEETIYPSNTYVDLFFNDTDEFSIVPTSNSSILTLEAYPGAINDWYDWLEGVSVFSSIIFNMNVENLYTKWSQGQQGQYRVQFAQYVNCIFWSDLGYISDVTKRTNYTMYSSAQLPLCYSTIPDNTFKAFYCAYGVNSDPNWSNPTYKESFSKQTHATQVFSYYGAHNIGVYDMDSSYFNIPLPKDCRGLMYAAQSIENAGVFDASLTTNFGAKSGSWRDAFGFCTHLRFIYIKNLKVNLNLSWSPVNQDSIIFILENAANTNKITISLSPHTYYGLTQETKDLATSKNIVLELITTNYEEDKRLTKILLDGDGTYFLSNNGTYKKISHTSDLINDSQFITEPQLNNYTIDGGEY